MVLINQVLVFADYGNSDGVFAAEVWAFSGGYFVVEGVFGGICFLDGVVAIA